MQVLRKVIHFSWRRCVCLGSEHGSLTRVFPWGTILGAGRCHSPICMGNGSCPSYKAVWSRSRRIREPGDSPNIQHVNSGDAQLLRDW